MGCGARLEFLDRCNQPLNVLRPRETMIAVFNQGQHNIIAGKARHEFDGMSPGHVRILDSLQDMYRTVSLYQSAKQQVFATVLDQSARDWIRILAICRWPQPKSLLLDFVLCRLRKLLPH